MSLLYFIIVHIAVMTTYKFGVLLHTNININGGSLKIACERAAK